MLPKEIKAIRGGLWYETRSSTLIAGDDDKANGNYEKGSLFNENTFLYLTNGGRYFKVIQVAGKAQVACTIVPLDKTEALDLWSDLKNKRTEFETAFGGISVPTA